MRARRARRLRAPRLARGCHTFHAYTTKDWPDEWFALNKKDQRVRSTSGSGPSQICLTNPEVRKAVCAQLRDFIRRDRGKAASPALYPLQDREKAADTALGLTTPNVLAYQAGRG